VYFCMIPCRILRGLKRASGNYILWKISQFVFYVTRVFPKLRVNYRSRGIKEIIVGGLNMMWRHVGAICMTIKIKVQACCLNCNIRVLF